jgi:hypothetical protein
LGALADVEVPVDVVCGDKHGTYLIKAAGVVCHCAACVEQHAKTGKPHAVADVAPLSRAMSFNSPSWFAIVA